MKMKKLVANKPRQQQLRLANSLDKSDFENDRNDDCAIMDCACSHCERKAQLAQLRAITEKDSEIRMSGYIEKKRTSIAGGWRKLYFVLQNRFLLSYRSQDTYEPIKDIIRLNPGMTIVASAGLRIKIITNSYTLHTLRCYSQQTFSEWITVLLNVLANAKGEATYERKLSEMENLQRSSIVPMMSSEVCLTVAANKATAATDGGSREVGSAVMPARQSSGTGSIDVPKLTLLSECDALKSNALPQPVENEKRQENNEKNHNKQTKMMHQSEYGETDHQRTEKVITQSFQFPDKSKLSSNISESNVPEQYMDIYSPVMGDQSFDTESGTLPMIMRQSTNRNIHQQTSRSCSDLRTVHTAMDMINTSLSKSPVKVAMHSYTNVHVYVPLLSEPNNPCVAPPSPNITLMENKIVQPIYQVPMSPIYATIDIQAKKYRRAQLQQLANGLPTSIKQSNSDDELSLSRGAGERSRTESSNISESNVPEQYMDIYSPVMGDQSFDTESGTLPMIMRQSTNRNIHQRTSRSCSDLRTVHTAMDMINTSLSKSPVKVPMHSYTNVHEYAPLLPEPNNPCVAPPSPNITLMENKIVQPIYQVPMSPIYATIDIQAKKYRRAQLQQLANGLPTSIKQSNSDDELSLSRGAGERSRTVDDSGYHIYEDIENILPAIIVNPKSSDSDVNVSNVAKNVYIAETEHLSTLTKQSKCDYELLSNEPLVSGPDPTHQNSGGDSSVCPLYEDVIASVAVTDTKEELMIMRMNNDNKVTENVYEEIPFPPPASGDALSRTKSMLLPAGNKTTQSSTTKHDRSIAHAFWKMLKRGLFPGSSYRRKESPRDCGQQQSPGESIILQGKGRKMKKGQKKSLRKRIMKSLKFDRHDYHASRSSRSTV